MTLADLYDQLAPSFPVNARKDVKTAIHVLAVALECDDPTHCPLDHFNRPLPALYTLVEDYLVAQGKKPHTVRNIKNYLSRLFRFAEAQHLFSLRPVQLLPHYDVQHIPSRPGGSTSRNNGTYLPYVQWPPDLQTAFMEFHTWATAPLVSGRSAHLRKRSITLEQYKHSFEGYFGYLSRVQRLIPTFDHLFDLGLLRSYIHWHVNDYHHKPTRAIDRFLINVLALLRQYRPLPELRADVLALSKTLSKPSPTYNKADAWVSLDTLKAIAYAIWPRKKPTDLATYGLDHPGLIHAIRAGYALMFHLWTYRPYRQRNMREMELGEHLYKDTQGHWRITFRGEQLKIALKRGRLNVFDLPFPQKLVPLLEDYLRLWRPILLAKSLHPHQEQHVFLTRYGTPYTLNGLAAGTGALVRRYTGKHWHPHIIRTVWATEWIRNTRGDFYTAAVMLNDKLETVIAKYTHLLEEDVAEKADRLIEERNGQGK